ncbi:type II toxin-antitoxin system PemK/MazF family toxin [Pseudobacteroides cellulosolvens]|uniref:PemK family protein n=1 Tax=Pseudobacteroides cellulosolvens ATCC 35603 = DSM 2933 TaxID=398512 RepID=A0A0L6JHP8_9FIRM|nr:type II toxin-antitoxin system PemK/MazF family toxin [Pseudobacteroides cellulosolvens]KNY25017.1 PemK family protein [Pseudobacteroides cellulosolvens ATCC 35603 = DSM 2933]
MEESLNNAKKSLDKFYEKYCTTDDNKRKLLACDYLKWITIKTKIIYNEKDFRIPENIQIKRGMVFWINFGYNIDEELGGKHPGLVLRIGGKTAIVIPLSTQEPTQEQLKSGTYVEIMKVYNFKNVRRWVNVLNTIPISVQRFDFNSSIGNVKGTELDNINAGMKKSGLWKF